ncbi:nitrite reductase (NADH) large subunit [Hydrogenispora ethanolica]|uniref:Nitrite reductase (NADH) large subunit n=1 Tax=Hydrogenispora ethanolica TaxID=1082276 RepID=A0A4R1R2X3_HYDET|nr:FAD-dependent oxidoreductase [Hydrogenispora ethanolica]TCL59735.1 nitrite reductase (NADH) large subunit [Hydrogenispora ethanolica]
MVKKVVIVGAGIAGINAIKAIREKDSEVPIDLVSDEPFFPYNRMKLSKGLFELELSDNLLQKKEWYAQNRVNLLLGEAVRKIDVRSQTVTLHHGAKLEFDKLLIATGALNREPELSAAGEPRLYTLRKMNDARQVLAHIDRAGQVVHIGGGIQGLETAWALRQHRKKVTITEIQARLMPFQLDEKGSDLLQHLAEDSGVEVITGSPVVGMEQTSVQIGAGKSIPCDMAIYSIGIIPNLAIVDDTGIRTNRGILVNERMETNLPHIYAAGDVAEYDGKIFGLWNIAVEQGKTAGYNLIGHPASYRPVVPVTTLRGFDITLFSMGDVDESHASHSVVHEDISKNTYIRVFIQNNRISGAIMIGDTGKSPLLKSAIEKQTLLEDISWNQITVEDLFQTLKTDPKERGTRIEQNSVL